MKLSLDEMKRIVIGTLVANGVKLEEAENMEGYIMDEYFDGSDIYVKFEGYTITKEAGYGGFEGAGDNVWFVFKVTKDSETQYFRKSGYYDSWNGTEWDYGIELVKPKEVMVIEWEPYIEGK